MLIIKKNKTFVFSFFVLSLTGLTLFFSNCDKNIQSYQELSSDSTDLHQGMPRHSTGEGFVSTKSITDSPISLYSLDLKLLNGEQLAHSYLSLLGLTWGDGLKYSSYKEAINGGLQNAITYSPQLEANSSGNLMATANLGIIACTEFISKEYQETDMSKRKFLIGPKFYTPFNYNTEVVPFIAKISLLLWGRAVYPEEAAAYKDFYDEFMLEEAKGNVPTDDRGLTFFVALCTAMMSSIETVTY